MKLVLRSTNVSPAQIRMAVPVVWMLGSRVQRSRLLWRHFLQRVSISEALHEKPSPLLKPSVSTCLGVAKRLVMVGQQPFAGWHQVATANRRYTHLQATNPRHSRWRRTPIRHRCHLPAKRRWEQRSRFLSKRRPRWVSILGWREGDAFMLGFVVLSSVPKKVS